MSQPTETKSFMQTLELNKKSLAQLLDPQTINQMKTILEIMGKKMQEDLTVQDAVNEIENRQDIEKQSKNIMKAFLAFYATVHTAYKGGAADMIKNFMRSIQQNEVVQGVARVQGGFNKLREIIGQATQFIKDLATQQGKEILQNITQQPQSVQQQPQQSQDDTDALYSKIDNEMAEKVGGKIFLETQKRIEKVNQKCNDAKIQKQIRKMTKGGGVIDHLKDFIVEQIKQSGIMSFNLNQILKNVFQNRGGSIQNSEETDLQKMILEQVLGKVINETQANQDVEKSIYIK